MLFVVSVLGGAAAVGRLAAPHGDIQVSPHAVATALRRVHAERKTPTPLALPKAADTHSWLWTDSRDAHDPVDLAQRANTIAALGVDLVVVEVRVGTDLPSSMLLEPANWPVMTTAFEVVALPPNSAFALFGLQPGDRLLSVNGFRPIDAGFRARELYSTLLIGPRAIIEVLRGSRRVVLDIERPRQEPVVTKPARRLRVTARAR